VNLNKRKYVTIEILSVLGHVKRGIDGQMTKSIITLRCRDDELMIGGLMNRSRFLAPLSLIITVRVVVCVQGVYDPYTCREGFKLTPTSTTP
jgi:hypothetical protein